MNRAGPINEIGGQYGGPGAVIGVAIVAMTLSLMGVVGCHVPVAAKKPRAQAMATWSEAVKTKQRQPPPPPARHPTTFVNADDCERAARQWLDVDKDEAWRRVIGCTTRTDFAYLRRLLRAPWRDLIQTKKDAAFVLAKVIAARGGNLDDDLQLLRRARIPIFPFASALASPTIYDGKLVLVRGRVLEERQSKWGAEIHVEETVRVAHLFERRTDVVEDAASTSSFARDDRDLQRRNIGVNRKSRRTERQRIVYDVEHKSKETGRDLVATMRRADPFLVTGRDFVFLIRFRGSAVRGKNAGSVVSASHSVNPMDAETGLGALIAFYEASLVRVD